MRVGNSIIVGNRIDSGAISPATAMNFQNGSSPRRASAAAENDIEAGPATRRSSDFDDVDVNDPFDIARTKHASVERLRRWRVSFLFYSISYCCSSSSCSYF